MNTSKEKNILLVDDEAVIRRILRRAIGNLNRQVEITEAEDGQEALQHLQESRFDMIVLDVKMPGMSGLEVLKKIREDEATRGTTVMMLTSESQPEDIYKGLDGGATSYLTKPFDVEEVVLVLESHLSGNLDRAPDEQTNDW